MNETSSGTLENSNNSNPAKEKVLCYCINQDKCTKYNLK